MSNKVREAQRALVQFDRDVYHPVVLLLAVAGVLFLAMLVFQ